MKILFFGNGTIRSNDHGYANAIRNCGVEVVFFDEEGLYQDRLAAFGAHLFLKKLLSRFFWRLLAGPIQRQLLARVREEKPDGIFILKGRLLNPKTLQTIKTEYPQIRIACFNPDNPFNTWHHGVSNSWIRKSIPIYDTYFIWGKFLVPLLAAAGASRVEYLPFAYDPVRNAPAQPSASEVELFSSDVAFMGSWDEERENWLAHLLDYDLKIWGNSWEKASAAIRKKWQGRDVIDSDFAKICSSSKIILNFVRKQNGSANNMRTFEVPACGGFLLSTRTEEQSGFLKEGVEADYFANPEELKRKIDFYLDNDVDRRRIAAAGILSIRPHTLEARAKRVIECMAWN